MRTHNTTCILCAKPLYRRPSEMLRVRYAACMGCRAKAQSVVGVTEAQRTGLKKGSVKGTNHRRGYFHRAESKVKCSLSHKTYWAKNPDAALARGLLIRGEKSPHWKGGASRLNCSIRQMTESQKWMNDVKSRDNKCLKCESIEELESHHIESLASMISRFGIHNRDDARQHAEVLWNISNGKTLCRKCHAEHHGKAYIPSKQGKKYQPKIKAQRISNAGSNNPNWKGGLIEKPCLCCQVIILVKRCIHDRGHGKFCGKECFNAYKRNRVQSPSHSPTSPVCQSG